MELHRIATESHSRLLGVFAHPDDEVFCAGGVLAQWATAGRETIVISATRGEAGQIQDGEAATRRTLGAVRERELRAACRHLGVQWVECLDYRDGALVAVDEMTLARDVAARIARVHPDVVVTFGPDGGYGHPDHVAISRATTLACQQIADAGGHAPHLYYSAFPRQHHFMSLLLARWLVRHGEPFHGSDGFVRALGLLAEEATLMGYADDSVGVKWFPAGLSIVEQGEPGISLYLVVSGHAEVVQEDVRGRRQVRCQLGQGQFFGQEALVQHLPQPASLIARDTVTCLVLSTDAPTPFDGRGSDAHVNGTAVVSGGDQHPEAREFTCVDVSPWLGAKVAALSAHRTQFLMEPAQFPSGLLDGWLGSEYFTHTMLTAAGSNASGCAADGMRDPAVRHAMAAHE
jgi:LmbE family N-acetylglucosaminyl deacetylase